MRASSNPHFRHEAFLYEGTDGFLSGTVAFLRDALERDDPVMVMVGSQKIDLLREALNGDADEVRFADMGEIGPNPARIIPAWREFAVGAAQSGKPLRGIGEPVWAGRSPAELIECQHHESLLNVAFADGPPMRLLCPYDTGALAPEVIDEAHRSHPVIVDDGEHRDSDVYRGIVQCASPLTGPLPAPPAHAQTRGFDVTAVHDTREFVAARARAAGLDPSRTSELVLAVSEVTTNSVRHGGGRGELSVWVEGGTVLCEVRDRGRFDRPLAGRERPQIGQVDGFGLWIANNMCDLVQIRSTPGGTTVRLHMRLS